MNRTAVLTVAGALSLAACAHHDSARNSKVPLGATEMQPTDAPSTRQPTEVASKSPASSSSPDDVASGSRPEALSSRVNARNPSDANATPTDQGSGALDLAITRGIHKTLMADKKLSAAGRNVTILTSDSRVVLKGRVNSEQERARIEAKARAMGGVIAVYNQLEVRR
jgi:hypothetical protein